MIKLNVSQKSRAEAIHSDVIESFFCGKHASRFTLTPQDGIEQRITRPNESESNTNSNVRDRRELHEANQSKKHSPKGRQPKQLRNLNERTFTRNPLGEIIPPIQRLGLNWQGSERSVRVNLVLAVLCFPLPLLLHPSFNGSHSKSSGRKELCPSQVREDPRTKKERIRRGVGKGRDFGTKRPKFDGSEGGREDTATRV